MRRFRAFSKLLFLFGSCSLLVACFLEPIEAQELGTGAKANQGGAAGYAIYELAPSPILSASDANRLSQILGLELITPQKKEPETFARFNLYVDKNGQVRGVFDVSNGRLELFPDLAHTSGPVPLPERAKEIANSWIHANRIAEFGVGKVTVEATALSRQDFGLSGSLSPAADVIQTVHFFRRIDGLRVFGPDSILSVEIDSTGVVGAGIGMREIDTEHRVPVEIITPQEAEAEVRRQYDSDIEQLKRDRYELEISEPELVYFEQGQQFVQPAYRFIFRAVGKDGIVDFNRLILAAKTVPELILDDSRSPLPIDEPLFAHAGGKLPFATNDNLKAGTTNVLALGMYILREPPLPGWVNDGLAFLAGFQAGNIARQRIFAPLEIRVDQYYSDEVWMWEQDGHNPDLSPQFVGKANFAVHEGDGNMWRTASVGNWSKTIQLDRAAGYGEFTGEKEITSYILWMGCSIIPAPVDPYCAEYKHPAKPSDVWFKIFQGMRGSYGFRTQMYVDGGVGGAFGKAIGFGVPNLSAWFFSIDNSLWGHSIHDGGNGCPYASDPGMEFGSAVIVCSHESDTAHDTGAVPPPKCLTIWWQHM